MKNERRVKLAKKWGSYAMLALFLTACTALTTWTQSGDQANAASEKMVLLGNLQNTGGMRSVGNAGVTIYINKLATQQEVNEIVEMLRARGPQRGRAKALFHGQWPILSSRKSGNEPWPDSRLHKARRRESDPCPRQSPRNFSRDVWDDPF